MKKKHLLTLIIIAILLIGCADVNNINECIEDSPYGFFGGLWHGMICVLSFFGSLFFDDIAIYAVNNNGGLYDLGFVLGAVILFGGSGKVSS